MAKTTIIDVGQPNRSGDFTFTAPQAVPVGMTNLTVDGGEFWDYGLQHEGNLSYGL